MGVNIGGSITNRENSTEQTEQTEHVKYEKKGLEAKHTVHEGMKKLGKNGFLENMDTLNNTIQKPFINEAFQRMKTHPTYQKMKTMNTFNDVQAKNTFTSGKNAHAGEISIDD